MSRYLNILFAIVIVFVQAVAVYGVDFCTLAVRRVGEGLLAEVAKIAIIADLADAQAERPYYLTRWHCGGRGMPRALRRGEALMGKSRAKHAKAARQRVEKEAAAWDERPRMWGMVC